MPTLSLMRNDPTEGSWAARTIARQQAPPTGLRFAEEQSLNCVSAATPAATHPTFKFRRVNDWQAQQQQPAGLFWS